MAKNYTPVATYPSKSNPAVTHTVHVDENGDLSCTCPGWCKHPPPRSCTHTRQEEAKRQAGQRATGRETPSMFLWSHQSKRFRLAPVKRVVA